MPYKSNISKSEINTLPMWHFEGKIKIIDSQEKLKKVIPELRLPVIWGFDTETKPNFKKGIANLNKTSLIQLATTETVYLFRTNIIGFPEVLRNIFENKNITKIGVATNGDISELNAIANKKINAKSFIDLQTITDDFNIEANSLRSLVAIILNKRISKSQQLSNWGASELTKQQKLYAATDAYAPLVVYNKLFDIK